MRKMRDSVSKLILQGMSYRHKSTFITSTVVKHDKCNILAEEDERRTADETKYLKRLQNNFLTEMQCERLSILSSNENYWIREIFVERKSCVCVDNNDFINY